MQTVGVPTITKGLVVVFALAGLGFVGSCGYQDLRFLHDARLLNDYRMQQQRAQAARPPAQAPMPAPDVSK